jgi:hypothetical protein
VCFVLADGVHYPLSKSVSPRPTRDFHEVTANTYAHGHGILKNKGCVAQDAARAQRYGEDAAYDAVLEAEDQSISSRRRTRGEISGVTEKLAAAGFTITDCDDPDERDPLEAAQEARERAIELHEEVIRD